MDPGLFVLYTEGMGILATNIRGGNQKPFVCEHIKERFDEVARLLTCHNICKELNLEGRLREQLSK